MVFGVNAVNELVNGVDVPSDVFVPAIVGFADVPYTTPSAVTALPPLEVTVPPDVAVVLVIDVAVVVVTVGEMAAVVKLLSAP